MSNAKQVIVGGVPISLKDEVARDSIGNLSNLNTTAKNNLVAAINEAAQSGSGEGSDPEAVKYTSQSLNDSQKTQARTNIGAGTYSKPSGGIPASDLASGVVPDVSGFYTKPASGIPASDIASGVIPTVPTISTDVSADAASDVKTSSPKSVKTYVDAGIAAVESDLSDLEDVVGAIDIGAYVIAWDGNSEPVVANIPAGVTVTYNTTTYTGELAASASTIQKIYLVATGTTDNYDRYITVGDSTYSWVNLGTTEITLADYATKAEVNELELEVHNLSGKYYGLFEDDSDLPEGDVKGYAFVGTAEPLALYSFDGTSWNDSGIEIYGLIGPQGPQGEPGGQGERGPQGLPGVTSAVASADNNSGVPSVDVALNNGVLSFTFHNIKGAQGNTGSSVDYPFTLVNNVTTEDATQALSAAMGKYLNDLVVGNNVDVPIDLSAYSLIGFFINNLQTWSATGTSSNNSNGILIPLTGISKVKLVATGSRWYTFLKDNYTASNQSPHYATGYNGRVNLVDATAVLDVPSDANYLYLITATSTGVSVLSNWAAYDIQPSSGAVFRSEIVDNLESNQSNVPLSAKQGNVLKGMINGSLGSGYKFHPVTKFGESQNGTIVTVYDSEYTKMDVEKYRGKNILVHNMHSATGYSQILDGSNSVLASFNGEDTSVGTVTIPGTAKWFVISNSFVKNPDFYVSIPSELRDNDGLIFGENFLFGYDAGDFSQFNGTVVSGKGLQLPGTGENNGLIVDKVVALDNWSLVADFLTSNNTETVVLGTKITQPGSANHSTRVEVAFGTAKISIYNNATNNLVVQDSISSIIGGNIYTVKLERIDRNIKATIINRTNGQSVSVVSNDYPQGSGQEGINAAGKMFDSPIFYVGSGTPWLQNLYATCLTRAKVLIVGDSITAGAHTTYENTWAPNVAEYFGNSLSGGRGSGQVLCCLNQLRSLIPVVKPKAVIVTIGTNYISNIAKSGYAGLFKSIVNLIREYDAIPIVNNVCACDARKTGLTIINEVVDELKQIGCRFDLATSLNNDWDDGQDSQYYYTDDVHLNDAGNSLLYNIVTSQLGWLKNI